MRSFPGWPSSEPPGPRAVSADERVVLFFTLLYERYQEYKLYKRGFMPFPFPEQSDPL